MLILLLVRVDGSLLGWGRSSCPIRGEWVAVAAQQFAHSGALAATPLPFMLSHLPAGAQRLGARLPSGVSLSKLSLFLSLGVPVVLGCVSRPNRRAGRPEAAQSFSRASAGSLLGRDCGSGFYGMRRVSLPEHCRSLPWACGLLLCCRRGCGACSPGAGAGLNSKQNLFLSGSG